MSSRLKILFLCMAFPLLNKCMNSSNEELGENPDQPILFNSSSPISHSMERNSCTAQLQNVLLPNPTGLNDEQLNKRLLGSALGGLCLSFSAETTCLLGTLIGGGWTTCAGMTLSFIGSGIVALPCMLGGFIAADYYSKEKAKREEKENEEKLQEKIEEALRKLDKEKN